MDFQTVLQHVDKAALEKSVILSCLYASIAASWEAVLASDVECCWEFLWMEDVHDVMVEARPGVK